MKTKNIVSLIVGVATVVVSYILLVSSEYQSDFVIKIIFLESALILALYLLINSEVRNWLIPKIVQGWNNLKSSPFASVMVTITVTAIGGYLGFNINNYLSRDKLSVEQIKVSHADLGITLSLKAKQLLIDLQKTGDRDSDYLFNYDDYNNTRTLTQNDKPIHTKLLKARLAYLKYRSDTYLTNVDIWNGLLLKYGKQDSTLAVSYLKAQGETVPKYVNSDYGNYEALRGKNKIGSLNYGDDDSFNDGEYYGRQGKSKNVQKKDKNKEYIDLQIKNNYFEIERFKKGLKEIINEILEDLRKHKNDFRIDLIVYNQGDKQSVVKYGGYLELKDNNDAEPMMVSLTRFVNFSESLTEAEQIAHALKQDENELNDFTVIYPKAFKNISLTIDEASNSNVVKSNTKIDLFRGFKHAKVKLFKISGEEGVVQSFVFESDVYDEIMDFLRKKFNEKITPGL